jgi:hypothetical protein
MGLRWPPTPSRGMTCHRLLYIRHAGGERAAWRPS